MENLEEAKKIYYLCLGSDMAIDREYKEYRKYNVPETIEKEWKNDIKNILLRRIVTEKGCARMQAVGAYIQLVDAKQAVTFLLNFVRQKTLDVFSEILVLESLKHYLSCETHKLSLALIEQIQQVIKEEKQRLQKSDMVIDASYKELNYMKDYDFSNSNILKRINAL